MAALYHALSGIRYVVLVASMLALLFFLIETLRGKPFASPGPAILATLTGLVYLQVALASLLYASGGRSLGVLVNLGLMISVLAALHTTSFVRKRRPQPTGYGISLVGVVVAASFVGIAISSTGMVWSGHTDLFLTITADHPGISAIEVIVRNIDYDEDMITKYIDPTEREIQWDPLVTQFLPSHIARLNEPFLVRARGYVNVGTTLHSFSAQSVLLEFESGKRLEETMTLRHGLDVYDDDRDGFFNCLSILLPLRPDLCDCNDRDMFENPFTVEDCANSIDDDCDGQVNEGCPAS